MECSRHTEGDSAVRLMPALRVVATGEGFRVVLRVRRRRAYRTGRAAGAVNDFRSGAEGGPRAWRRTQPSRKDGPFDQVAFEHRNGGANLQWVNCSRKQCVERALQDRVVRSVALMRLPATNCRASRSRHSVGTCARSRSAPSGSRTRLTRAVSSTAPRISCSPGAMAGRSTTRTGPTSGARPDRRRTARKLQRPDLRHYLATVLILGSPRVRIRLDPAGGWVSISRSDRVRYR
jgi:hypothetical protein